MAQIVIVGAGLGGLSMSFAMRKAARTGDTVTVLSDSARFHFVPSNPWVAVGWRKRDDISVDLQPILEKRGIGFDAGGVKRIHPERNEVELASGETVAYDYLVIATGPKLAFDEIDGLGPQANTQSICHIDHAEAASTSWNAFVQNPGPVLVGAVQGASCFGPVYEHAMIMDTDLRRRKIRDRVPMTLITPEPYVGHLGLGGVGDSKGMLESTLREHDIKWICNAKTTRVAPNTLYATELDDLGHERRTHELPFSYCMMLPAFRGVDAVAGIGDLTNPRGFVLIDEFQRNPTYRNVYAVGVCVAIAPLESTPVPTGVPKTGFMIESMVHAAAENIRASLDGHEPSARATWNAICLADFGDRGIAFVALPQIPPRNLNWSSEGKWVHAAKIAFEKYFLHRMRTGATEPAYERLLLDMLGIRKLKH
ncbi:NAD(P)/FAD-dependent oxidoreductase [Burkholderia thailandensis]|nr:FAD/NAD(P)-binding oxidoreductase [Burkholderia thailandensis]AHI66693.1 sulfide-quinone reductase [Burkholderia thailandensis H0587]AIP65579.1 pyridine nucleotide-disulfide oxidoreductase [Burkholderia thailandensis]AOI53755.1 pyridine nucleotide-disulfide oxidoreductase [Burkholderia thailandensis]AOJ52736.1 pyridine nucleotide-disulfide oxidoreductase [Burkholderia thailandensis]AVR29168.1 NAD(P)/FAD-dependent oxidoreductase [Burkholderia thailandensis]